MGNPGAGFGENRKMQWTPHAARLGLLASSSEHYLPAIPLPLSVNALKFILLVLSHKHRPKVSIVGSHLIIISTPRLNIHKIDASLDPATSNGLNLKPSRFPPVVPDQTLHRATGRELDGLLVARGAGTSPPGT